MPMTLRLADDETPSRWRGSAGDVLSLTLAELRHVAERTLRGRAT